MRGPDRLGKGDRFEVTADHIALLRAAYVGWWDCATGAPCLSIEPKRPYGDSDVAPSALEVLGEKPASSCRHCGDELSEEQEARMLRLHRETAIALQVVLVTGAFEPGVYVKTEEYDDHAWERVTAEPAIRSASEERTPEGQP